jgi:hypothetical protein
MKIGDSVSWWRDYWIDVNGKVIQPGDLGRVIEIHPTRPGTGLMIGVADDGAPLYDTGLDGWAVVEFANGARRAHPLPETLSG